jgi:hypothetical protein
MHAHVEAVDKQGQRDSPILILVHRNKTYVYSPLV